MPASGHLPRRADAAGDATSVRGPLAEDHAPAVGIAGRAAFRQSGQTLRQTQEGRRAAIGHETCREWASGDVALQERPGPL